MMDEKAKEIIERVLARRRMEPADVYDTLIEIEGQARGENVAICAVQQAAPRTHSERVDDFRHEPWCETAMYTASFRQAMQTCPTCGGEMKESAR
jgi:hypothetical protein